MLNLAGGTCHSPSVETIWTNEVKVRGSFFLLPTETPQLGKPHTKGADLIFMVQYRVRHSKCWFSCTEKKNISNRRKRTFFYSLFVLNAFLFRFLRFVKKDDHEKGQDEAKIIEDFNSFLAWMHGQRTMAKVNREM